MAARHGLKRCLVTSETGREFRARKVEVILDFVSRCFQNMHL